MNKALKWTLIGVGFCIVCGALAPKETKIPSAPQKAQEADKGDIAALGVYSKTRDTLRDPRSMQVNSVVVLTPKNGMYVGCMDYSAKNGFGGMTRNQSTWVLDGNKFQFGNSAALFNKYCANKQGTDKTALAQSFNKKLMEN